MEATLPYNGSGTFSRLYSWVVDAANAVNISSSRTDAEMNGFAAGLTNCITRDGQSPPSADLPMGGKKLVNLGLATVGTDALSQNAGDARYILLSGLTNLTLSGTLTAATLSLSGNASIAGTLGVTGNANFSGTVAATGDISANGGALVITTNNKGLFFKDVNGGLIELVCDSGNNFDFFGTDATGASRLIWSVPMHSSSGAFAFNVAATGPTPTGGDNSTKLATTAFIVAALASYAPLASPTLTGTPTAPTAAVGTSTTQIATTAFVQAARPPIGQTITSAATVTPTFNDDFIEITAQAAGLTLANPTGTAVNMWGAVDRIKDNGTPQTIAFGTQYRGVGVTLPTTTVAGKTLVLGRIFNSALTKWDVVSVAQE